MALSALALCSRALLKIGAQPIASFDEGTAEAEVAANLYPAARDALLSLHPWSFATAQATLPRLAEQWDDEGPDVRDAVLAEDDAEETEYAALMTAADASAELLAGLPDGRRRRVVVVVTGLTARRGRSRPSGRCRRLPVRGTCRGCCSSRPWRRTAC